MRIVLLGATGGTGRQLVADALARGHEVIAVVRRPASSPFQPSATLTVLEGDVRSAQSFSASLHGVDAVISTIGSRKGDPAGVLEAGARTAVSLEAPRLVALGALGAERSRAASGALWSGLLSVVAGKQELADKNTADSILLNANATIFHAAQLTDKPLSPTRRTIPATDLPRRLIPRPVSRATVAALMLDELEKHPPGRGIVIPLD